MDDNGIQNGLPAGALSVVAGELNADPVDCQSVAGAAGQRIEHRLVSTSAVPAR